MKQKISFEEAFSILEDKVKQLENGNMTLDESLTAFEEAIKIVKVCNDRLDAAEGKIRILTASPDGTVSDAPFDTTNEA